MKFLKNVYYFLQGNLRYQLFYSKLSFLIPKYVREQIEYRILSMDIECYENGSCKKCGCATTQLQMANKACPKPCYPEIMSRKKWKEFIEDGIIIIDGITWFNLELHTGMKKFERRLEDKML